MTRPEVSMLWENAEPGIVLARRFGFDSPEAASSWVMNAVGHTHGLELECVDRLVLSAVNLLATVSAPGGRFLVKCCAMVAAHEPLRALGELIWWLDGEGIPVSAPVPSRQGTAQVMHEHLTFNVQQVVDGSLLDATDRSARPESRSPACRRHSPATPSTRRSCTAGRRTVSLSTSPARRSRSADSPCSCPHGCANSPRDARRLS